MGTETMAERVSRRQTSNSIKMRLMLPRKTSRSTERTIRKERRRRRSLRRKRLRRKRQVHRNSMLVAEFLLSSMLEVQLHKSLPALLQKTLSRLPRRQLKSHTHPRNSTMVTQKT